MGLFRKNNGAISIFLVIVLVPMLVLASIFVDMGRVKLGKAIAESAGDLTANTALTNYDAVLKDMYGLFAMSQTEKELYDNLEEYYKQCLKAAGIGDVEADDYVGNILKLLKEEAGDDDLMNLSVKDDTFKFTQEETGTLANPALLKSQIVDFMKYRAPINLGTSIIDAIKCLDGVQEQTETVEKKNEFYEKQTDMMEKLEKAWSYIEDYEYRDYFPTYTDSPDDPWTFPNRDLLKSNINNLRTGIMLNVLVAIRLSAAFLFYADENYDKWNSTENFYTITEKDSDKEGIEKEILFHDFTGKEHKLELVEELTGENVDLPTTSPTEITAIVKCFERIEQALLEINAFPDSDYNKTIGLFLRLDKEKLSTTDKIRLVSKASTVRYSYLEKITDFFEGLCELHNLLNDPEYQTEFDKVYLGLSRDENGSVKINRGFEKTSSTPNTARQYAIDEMNTYFLNGHYYLEEKFYNYNSTVGLISSYKKDTEAFVKEVKEDLTERTKYIYEITNSNYTFLDEKYKKLKEASDILKSVENDLSNPQSDYNIALSEWKKYAESLSGSDMGDSDLSEIASLSEVVTTEKVSMLKQRVDDVKDLMIELRTQVDFLTFLNTSWRTILDGDNPDPVNCFVNIIKEKGTSFVSALNNVPIQERNPEVLQDERYINTIGNYDRNTYLSIIGDYNDDEYAFYNIDFTYPYSYLVIGENSLAHEVTIPTFSMNFNEADQLYRHPDLEKNTGDLYIWMYNNFVEGNTKSEKSDYLAKKYKSRLKEGNTSGVFDNPVKEEQTTENKEIQEANDKGVDESEATKDSDKHIDTKKKEYKNAGSSTNPNRSIEHITLPSIDTEYHAILNASVKVTEDGDGNDSNLDDVKKDNVFTKMSESFSSLSNVINLVKDLSTELRDDLYITNYIMEMFSYSTLEPEISVNNGIKFPGAWYTAKEGVYTVSNDKVTQAMLDDASTLTLVEINPNFNYLYGQEVEYIIHGGSGKGAVAKTDITIFGLRFALDLVYAFTDAEVVNLALSTATALFGVPPLTPLIPVAKLAIIIGLAIAEATYDLVELKQGNGIPLVKSSETFVMKPSNALKKAASEVATVVVDKGVDVLNKIITMTDEELEKFLQENEDAMKDLATSSVNHAVSSLQNEANKAVEQAFSICYEINEEFKNDLTFVQGQSEEKIKEAENRLDAWLAEQKATDNTLVYEAKKTAVNLLKENGGKYIGDLFDYLKNAGEKAINQAEEGTKEAIGSTLDAIREKVNKAVTDAIESAGSALNEVKNQVRDELKEAVKNGGEELKNKLREQIGNSISEGADSTGTNSIVGSLLNWQYSDYLQLFVLIGLIANPEAILLRIADCIELNRRQINADTFTQVITTTKTTTTTKSRFFGLYKKTETKTETSSETVEGDASFKMRNAYVYLTLEADVEVKPLLLNLPLIRNYTGRDAGGDFFNIKYKMTQGY